MRERKGPWVYTSSGPFWPLDPQPMDFSSHTIARALSHLCRFGGHTRKFYSVAQHCVLAARRAPPALRFVTLMHDAPEAYIQDLVSPLKRELPEYQAIEARIWLAMSRRWPLPTEIPVAVKVIDERMWITEARQLLNESCGEQWRAPDWPEPFHDLKIRPWSSWRARWEFLAAFREYRPRSAT